MLYLDTISSQCGTWIFFLITRSTKSTPKTITHHQIQTKHHQNHYPASQPPSRLHPYPKSYELPSLTHQCGPSLNPQILNHNAQKPTHVGEEGRMGVGEECRVGGSGCAGRKEAYLFSGFYPSMARVAKVVKISAQE